MVLPFFIVTCHGSLCLARLSFLHTGLSKMHQHTLKWVFFFYNFQHIHRIMFSSQICILCIFITPRRNPMFISLHSLSAISSPLHTVLGNHCFIVAMELPDPATSQLALTQCMAFLLASFAQHSVSISRCLFFYYLMDIWINIYAYIFAWTLSVSHIEFLGPVKALMLNLQ